jgi:hypothetical protein
VARETDGTNAASGLIRTATVRQRLMCLRLLVGCAANIRAAALSSVATMIAALAITVKPEWLLSSRWSQRYSGLKSAAATALAATAAAMTSAKQQ